MAPQYWALRCCSCRLFQVQQAKRSGKWICSVCGQRQAVQKLYGQGSALDCRRHVQKLNLLQGEAEEAVGWTSRCVEDPVKDSKNAAAQHEDSSAQQEGRAEVSRWSKYLDKDNEDGEKEAGTERQQFCSWRKTTVEEQRNHPKSFLSSDAPEYTEENDDSQLAYQAKKRKRCSVAVPDQDDGDAVCGHSMAPAVCEPIVPKENTPTPSACTKPSKWEKFLSHSKTYSENAAGITSSPQEGSGRLGLHSMTAADAAMVSRCSEQAQKAPSQGTGLEFKKCVASTEQIGSKPPGTMVPSSSCSAREDVLFKEPQRQLIRAGSGVMDTLLCSDSTRRANTFVNCSSGPKPSTISYEGLFCTGDEFDDDL
uniref:MRN complex-interacting protein N-terminal domain-containing protein n=1 Tax=Amazona collaria TaxID=241587 RepID=A0A8B9FGU2_9PSIT